MFWPVPRVDSGLVSLARHRRPRPRPCAGRRGASETFAVIDAAFSQRRKTLRSALAAWAGSPAAAETVLRAAGVDPSLRGEALARHGLRPDSGGEQRRRRSGYDQHVVISAIRPTRAAVTVRVPAKVNLQLAVGPPRADGYHSLVTVFHAVSLFDEVTVLSADKTSLTVTGEDAAAVPLDRSNLAWKAASALVKAANLRGSAVEIRIRKRIPVAAGLAWRQRRRRSHAAGLQRAVADGPVPAPAQ